MSHENGIIVEECAEICHENSKLLLLTIHREMGFLHTRISTDLLKGQLSFHVMYETYCFDRFKVRLVIYCVLKTYRNSLSYRKLVSFMQKLFYFIARFYSIKYGMHKRYICTGSTICTRKIKFYELFVRAKGDEEIWSLFRKRPKFWSRKGSKRIYVFTYTTYLCNAMGLPYFYVNEWKQSLMFQI